VGAKSAEFGYNSLTISPGFGLDHQCVLPAGRPLHSLLATHSFRLKGIFMRFLTLLLTAAFLGHCGMGTVTAQNWAPDDDALVNFKRVPRTPKSWANKSNKLDRDGDGIPDELEKTPLAIGKTGLELTLNPKKKDLIVFIDHIGTTDLNFLDPNTLLPILDAFAQAPVRGVGAKKANAGVTLHVLAALPEYGYPIDDFTVLPLTGPGGTVDWSSVDTTKQAFLELYQLQDLPPIFHYALCALSNNRGSGGISRNGNTFTEFRQGASDFVISPGSEVAWADTNYVITTFMHELGHNLSLTHGGFDHINYKPNYFSVMNYFYYDGVDLAQGGVAFDYSRGLPKRLNESRLLETGLGKSASGFIGHSTFYNGAFFETLNHLKPDKTNDWNDDGTIVKKGRQAYAAELNYSGPAGLTWLISENNWQNINFAGGLAMQTALLSKQPASISAAAALGLLPNVAQGPDDLPDYPGRYQQVGPGTICPPPPVFASRPAAAPAQDNAELARLQEQTTLTVGQGFYLLTLKQAASKED
jgi:hypothetical protein